MYAYKDMMLDTLAATFDKDDKTVMLVDDMLCELDSNNRNGLDDETAKEVLATHKMDLWLFLGGYSTYCEDNFGSIKCYQGESEVIPYKSVCLWSDTFLFENRSKIFGDKEQMAVSTFYRKLEKFVRSRECKTLIQQHYF